MRHKQKVVKQRIILALDSHQLNDYQMCPCKGYLANMEHLVPLITRRAFKLGEFMHLVLHRMGTARMNRRQFTDMQLIQMAQKRINRCKAFTPDEKFFYTRKFMEFFGIDKHLPYQIMGCEVGFSKILYEDNDVRFIYQGRIDRIDRIPDEKLLSWVDYKTQTKEYKIFPNANQFLGYSWALETNYGFIQFYGLQKEKPAAECFRRQSIHHPDALIAQWKKDTIRSFFEIASLLPLGSKAFERRRVACSNFDFNLFDINTCPYLKVCDNEPYGAEIVDSIKRTFYEKKVWHPWSGPLDKETL